MGILTTFYLLEHEHFRKAIAAEDTFARFSGFRAVRTGPMYWILFQKFAPTRFGLPESYEPKRCCVDKSWARWRPVLTATGWSDVYGTISELTPIANPWDREMGSVANMNDELGAMRRRLFDFDAADVSRIALEKASKGSALARVVDDGMLEYTIGHVDAWAKWFSEHYTPEHALVVSSH